MCLPIALTLAGIMYAGCLEPVEAQNVQCTTRPTGDTTNACASTTFVQNQIAAAALTTPTRQCVQMFPSANQSSGAWNVVDVYGNAVSTAGTTSQGLQEAITYSTSNGQCLRVYGQDDHLISLQSGTTTNLSAIVIGLTSTSLLLAGDYVTVVDGLGGIGIPAFTRILTVDSATQVTLTHNATASGARSIKFVRAGGPTLTNFIAASTTISIPAVENWDAKFSEVNLTSTSNGPAIQFDSMMMVDWAWEGGQIVHQPPAPTGTAYGVYVHPINPVPVDGLCGVVASRVYFTTIGSAGNQGVWGFNLDTCSIGISQWGSVELNGAATSTTGIVVFGPTASTVFEQNIFDLANIHGVVGAGVQLGTSTTNAANIKENIFRIGTIRPITGAPGAGLSIFGSYNQFTIGGITNEEAGGAVAQGVNFQASSVGSRVSIGQMVGVTTPLVDAGTCNSIIGGGLGNKFSIFASSTGCTSFVSGTTVGNSRTLTAPDATGTIVLNDNTATLSGKTIVASTITIADNAFTLQDNGDPTKQIQFDVSPFATGTTRTWTWPNANDVVVGASVSQTLTNKTLTSPILTTPTLGDASATSVTASGAVISNGGDLQSNITSNSVARLLKIRNSNAGSSAYAVLDFGNDTSASQAEFLVNSSTNTTYAGSGSFNITSLGDMGFFPSANSILNVLRLIASGAVNNTLYLSAGGVRVGGTAVGSSGSLTTSTELVAGTYASVGTKIRAIGTAPALTSCGTTPAIEGSDLSGTVTMGTGSPTGCVITFNVAYAAAPRCTVSWRANIASMQYTTSTLALTLTQTGTSSNLVDYVCTARTGG